MSKFKVVPTPDHGTRLVPVDPTPKTDEEWLKAACEHDITYGEDPTPPGSHTPGPWAVNCNRVYGSIGSGAATGIADMLGNCGSTTTVEANAHLIAAAPELLEALKNLIADWERVQGRAIPDDQEARAAIA